MIQLLSASTLPVLITGETGTGKGIIARAIHEAAPRKRPFVVIDCATLPEAVIESELFGHARGAFTGALTAHTGLFVSADGGTVFLDEIGELPMHSQVKLLHVLQEKEVRPVGTCRTVPVDVRIIAASNRDLIQEVKEKRFRMDLFYRLSVASLTVSPLRTHKIDIRDLVDHFLAGQQDANRSLGEGVLEVLEAYDWPGNVRELQNCVDFACLMSQRNEIKLSDLPDAITSSCLSKYANARSMDDASQFSMPSLERRAIETALAFTKGNVPLAAKKLGIGKTTLYRRLKEYRATAAGDGGYVF